MDETQQEKAIEALRDWSKWLIGVDFVAAAGCVLILENSSVSGAVTPFLVVAIASFILSVFCSVILVRELARVVEFLPLRDHQGNMTKVSDHRVAARIPLDTLAKAQLTFLGAGGFFFIVWILVRTAGGGA